MIYPNLVFKPHALERIKERVGIDVDTPEAEAKLIRRIQTDSIHAINDGKNKEIRFFRIGYKFYVAVIAKKRQLVLTVMWPNSGTYHHCIQQFERNNSRKDESKTVTRYVSWRKAWLAKLGWNTKSDAAPLNEFKEVMMWGEHLNLAAWNGNYWLDDEGEIVRGVLGWRDIPKPKRVHKTKVSDKINLCIDCAEEHTTIDTKHFEYAEKHFCGNCGEEKPTLPVSKDKTDLFEELEEV